MVCTITAVGNLTKDPAQASSSSGTMYCTSGIAVNKYSKAQDGAWEQKAMFFDLVAFGKVADRMVDKLSKGDKVLVIGDLDIRSYEDRNGTPRQSLGIVASKVELVHRKGERPHEEPASPGLKDEEIPF